MSTYCTADDTVETIKDKVDVLTRRGLQLGSWERYFHSNPSAADIEEYEPTCSVADLVERKILERAPSGGYRPVPGRGWFDIFPPNLAALCGEAAYTVKVGIHYYMLRPEDSQEWEALVEWLIEEGRPSWLGENERDHFMSLRGSLHDV